MNNDGARYVSKIHNDAFEVTVEVARKSIATFRAFPAGETLEVAIGS